MSLIAVWFLVIYVPNEAAGRQVGPFGTEAQCRTAERIYNERQSRYNGPQSVCLQGVVR